MPVASTAGQAMTGQYRRKIHHRNAQAALKTDRLVLRGESTPPGGSSDVVEQQVRQHRPVAAPLHDVRERPDGDGRAPVVVRPRMDPSCARARTPCSAFWNTATAKRPNSNLSLPSDENTRFTGSGVSRHTSSSSAATSSPLWSVEDHARLSTRTLAAWSRTTSTSHAAGA